MPSPLTAARPLTVVLTGNPNTGKSTLFNALTGGKARIGNFPGVTVEKKVGRFQHAGRHLTVIDLPGTYSLSPRSSDEMVSVDVLLGLQKDVPQPDVVVCILDATNLERNLYLVSQIRDLGLPMVLVLNMWDLVAKRGLRIDLEGLKRNLGVTVVTTAAHRRQGVEQVRQAIVAAADGGATSPAALFPDAFYDEVESLRAWLAERGQPDAPAYLLERMILDVGGESEHRAARVTSPEAKHYLEQARQRLAAAGCRIPVIETKVRYGWIREQLDGLVERTSADDALTMSDRLDKIFTHRIWGMAAFCLLMFIVFQAIFAWAEPMMGQVENVQTAVQEWIAGLMPPGTFRSLLNDGIVAGVGAVLVFIPQIVLLFFFIAVLEDCGYMARAAFLMDKLMTRLGLSGKSFLPLMSSFACAIPGVMATRTIESRRDRMVTILVAPLMSCSARLPVYLLMVGAFIPATAFLAGWVSLRGMVLFAMYSLGALVAIPVAWLLKKTFFRGETPPFVMELPPYKWPSPRIVFDRVYERARAFLVRAGTLIFAVVVVIWAAGYFPGDHSELQRVQAAIEQAGSQGDQPATGRLEQLLEEERRLSAALIRESYLGQIGRLIEPAVKPLGWDWRLGVGAVASFPAREVIIATLGTIFSLGGEVDDADPGLKAALQTATWPDGRPLFSIPVALSMMVFFALCSQCGATLVVIRRETNSWRWPLFTFAYMTALAYLGALLTYQIGTACFS